MTALIPGTHYFLGETLIDDLPYYVLTCALETCGEQIVGGAILWCEAELEIHWEARHKDLIR